jgi:hypothetical protein
MMVQKHDDIMAKLENTGKNLIENIAKNLILNIVK